MIAHHPTASKDGSFPKIRFERPIEPFGVICIRPIHPHMLRHAAGFKLANQGLTHLLPAGAGAIKH